MTGPKPRPSPVLFRSRTQDGRAERLAAVTARERVERMQARLDVTVPGTPQQGRARSRLASAESRLRAAEAAVR